LRDRLHALGLRKLRGLTAALEPTCNTHHRQHFGRWDRDAKVRARRSIEDTADLSGIY